MQGNKVNLDIIRCNNEYK